VGGDGAGQTLISIADYSGGATSPIPGAIFEGSRGTAASPTQVVANDLITFFDGRGMQSNGAFSGTSASVRLVALDSFTTSANGTSIFFFTTPSASTSSAFAAGVHGSTGFSVGTTTDPGAVAIPATGAIRSDSAFNVNGSAGLTTTCTVTAGNTYVFTGGILTSKGANCT